MYISVIPASHSINTTPLTYHVGDVFRPHIHIGSLVEIPLGKGIEYGIVAEINPLLGGGMGGAVSEVSLSGKEGGVIDIKSIVQVICSTPLLAPYQISLITSIARRYMIPIHRVLGFFLPRPVLSRLEKSNFGDLVSTPLGRGDMGGSALENLIPKGTDAKHQGSNVSSRILFLQNSTVTPEVLKQYITPGTIVVCPDDISLYQYEQALGKEGFFFLPNDATTARRSKAWRDIRNGVYPVILSTRKILFSNLGQYERILYLEDAFMNEYFHYPTHIHYNDILKFIDESGAFSIDILTSIPLINTLATFRHFTLQNIA